MVSEFVSTGTVTKSTRHLANRKRILLINEVDVFFKQDFFGQLCVAALSRYLCAPPCIVVALQLPRFVPPFSFSACFLPVCFPSLFHALVLSFPRLPAINPTLIPCSVPTRYVPMATIKSEAFSHLATQAWEMWSETGSIFWQKLSCTSAYNDVLQAFGDRADVVAELVKRMVQDLRSLPTHEYLIREGRIGYQEHDGISFKAWYGFKTMWAHFKEFHDGGKVSSQALEASIRMPLICCKYSYAEIPKSYECTMGVTGTLTSLSPEQTKVLEGTFKLTNRTIIPSVYGQQRLTFLSEDRRCVRRRCCSRER